MVMDTQKMEEGGAGVDEVAAIILSEIMAATSHLFLSEFVVVIHPVHAEAMKL